MQKLLHYLLTGVFLLATTLTSVQSQNVSICGLKLEVTAVGTHLIGQLKEANGTICTGGSIKWYDDKNNTLLQEGPQLDYYLPDYGIYNIRADFQIDLNNSQISCFGSLNQELMVLTPSCMQLFTQNETNIIPEVDAPVCGCNGQVYNSEFEARAAGVSSWWAGNCNAQPSISECGTTDLEIDVYGGNPTDGYWVRFTNLAQGNFTHIQLDFGDECQVFQAAQWTNKIHHYNRGGIYQATLSAWNINQPGCISSYSKTFSTDALSYTNASLPLQFDYVMPGDANGDGQANAYDLLRVSRGYGKTGAPRPEASNDWTPQFAPNWTQLANDGLNFKHIDGNGDGFINEFDTEPLEMHLQPITLAYPATFIDGMPQVYTRFAEDTLFVDPANPATLEINADIMVGSLEAPVRALSGLACALKYPDFIAHDPTIFYDPSFFGSSNYVLSLGRDNHDILQYDLGFARKNNSGVNGYGRLAKITFRTDFIIIIDIIDRAESDIVALTIPVEGIHAIDTAGNVITLSPAEATDTLWVKVKNTTSLSKENTLERSIQMAPNPAKDFVTIQTGNLNVNGIEVVNALGQLVAQLSPAEGSRATRIETGNWQSGVYTIRINTDEGVAEKKLIVH